MESRRRHGYPVPDAHQLRPANGRRGVFEETLRARGPAGLTPQGSTQ